jgi:hypothetical protein
MPSPALQELFDQARTLDTDLEQLKLQAAPLEQDVKQGNDLLKKMLAMQALELIFKTIIGKQLELVRVNEAQVEHLKAVLKSRNAE